MHSMVSRGDDMSVIRMKYNDYYQYGNTKYSVGVKRKISFIQRNTENKCYTNCNQELKV